MKRCIIFLLLASCATVPDHGRLWFQASNEFAYHGPAPIVSRVPYPLTVMIAGKRVYKRGAYDSRVNRILIEDTCRWRGDCEEVTLHEYRHAACILRRGEVELCKLGE